MQLYCHQHAKSLVTFAVCWLVQMIKILFYRHYRLSLSESINSLMSRSIGSIEFGNGTHRWCSIAEPIEQQSDRLGSIDFWFGFVRLTTLQSWTKVLRTVLQYSYFSVISRFSLKTMHPFGNFLAVRPPPTLYKVETWTEFWIHASKIVCGERGGVGLVWIGKRPRNAKVSQDFCPWLYLTYSQLRDCTKYLVQRYYDFNI